MLQEEIQAVLGTQVVVEMLDKKGIQAGVESLLVEQTQAEQEKLTQGSEKQWKKFPLFHPLRWCQPGEMAGDVCTP